MGSVTEKLETILENEKNSIIYLDSSVILNIGPESYKTLLNSHLNLTSKINVSNIYEKLRKKTQRNQQFKDLIEKYQERVRICPEVEKEIKAITEYLQRENDKDKSTMKESTGFLLQSTQELLSTLLTTDYHNIEQIEEQRSKYLQATIENISKGIEKKLETVNGKKPSYTDIKQIVGGVMLSKYCSSEIYIVTRDKDLLSVMDILESSSGYKRRIKNTYKIRFVLLPMSEGEIIITQNYGDFRTISKNPYQKSTS